MPDHFYPLSEITESIPVITIDGPSASGKGTISRRVAYALGWHYLDSGALYRLTALIAKKSGIDWHDESGIAKIASELPIFFANSNSLLDTVTKVTLHSQLSHNEEVAAGASIVASIPVVREILLSCQRTFRRAPGLVADGRDMGSTVFPDAIAKIFITANLTVRAQRRYDQLIKKGFSATLPQILLDLGTRDARDTARSVSPLKAGQGALFLETSDLTVGQVVTKILDWVMKSSGNRIKSV